MVFFVFLINSLLLMKTTSFQNLNRHIATLFLLLSLFSFAKKNTVLSDEKSNEKDPKKVAIITGSNRGMGLGWTKHFLNEGYTVIATARKPEKATDLIALKKQYKKKLRIEKLDVTSEEDMAALSETLKKRMIKIDIAISNAAVTMLEDFGSWTAKGFGLNYRVNTLGAALFAQAIAPYLKDGATLVQISSGAGSITYQKKSTDLDGYRVSKAGLNMLTKLLSIRFSDRKIIVVSVQPGLVLTQMNPNGNMSVEEAVGYMSKTIANLTFENTGTFINYNGKKFAW